MNVRLLGYALLSLSAGTAAQATNGYFVHAYGVQSQGEAGVAIALPQDALAAADNPAGTAWVGDRVDLGLTLFAPNYRATIQGNGYGADGRYDGSTKQFVIPAIGYARPVSDVLAAGIAVYGQGGMTTEYSRNPFGAFGGLGRAGVNLQQLFVTPSLAWRVIASQTVGAAVTFAYQRFSAEGLNAFATSSIAPSDLTNRGNEASTGLGGKLGWIGELLPGFKLGAAWSSKITPGKFDSYRGLFADGGTFDIPESFAAGLSYQATRALVLAVDAQRIRYGEVRAIANPLSNLFAGNALGSVNGPGFGWRDVSVVKLGASFQLDPAVTLRAGLSRTGDPIPADQTFFNILAPAVIRDHASIGATWRSAGGNEFSVAYSYAIRGTLDGRNSIPAPFGGGNADISLEENIFALSYGWKL